MYDAFMEDDEDKSRDELIWYSVSSNEDKNRNEMTAS